MRKHQQKLDTLSKLSSTFFLFLSDIGLINFFIEIGLPLPFSLSTLRKDRIDGRLGGIPFRKIGGLVVYTPGEVNSFLAGQVITQPARLRARVTPKKNKKRSKKEKAKYKKNTQNINQLELFDGCIAGVSLND